MRSRIKYLIVLHGAQTYGAKQHRKPHQSVFETRLRDIKKDCNRPKGELERCKGTSDRMPLRNIPIRCYQNTYEQQKSCKTQVEINLEITVVRLSDGCARFRKDLV